jgi:hypothetical protein
MAKLTKIEDIVNEITRWKIVDGLSTPTIISRLQDKPYNYGQRRAYQLLKEARGKVQELCNKNIEENLEEAKIQLETLFELNMTRKDYKNALLVRQEINKLMGLYPVKVKEEEKTNTEQPLFPDIK